MKYLIKVSKNNTIEEVRIGSFGFDADALKKEGYIELTEEQGEKLSLDNPQKYINGEVVDAEEMGK